MSTVYKCPACGVRWKIVESRDTREEAVYCPVCAPPEGKLFPLGIDEVFTPPKDAA